MPDGEGGQPQTQSQRPVRGEGQSHRRGRGGRGRGNANGGSSRGGRNAPSGTDATEGPTAAPSQTGPVTESSGQTRAGRGRGGRGQRRGGRGSATRAAPLAVGQRAFGGHLTAGSETSSAAASLSGDAPAFVPGQPVMARSKPSSKKQPRQKLPKSMAADLGTRIHEDVSNGNYECTICTDDVLRTSAVWSCTVCWTVIHLKCVRKWYDNQKKQDKLQPSQLPRDFAWRCPGCNSGLSDEPGTYHCWCGKDINPQPAGTALPPHSCGQTCSKPKATCPHPCGLQCHAGPCPPCDLMGPTQSCFCGKNTSRKRCRETDYENGWSCEEICGDLLPCGEHLCPRPCHPGLCGDCDTKVDARCYCGQVEKSMPCYLREDLQQSYSPAHESWSEASFNCEKPCERSFDCGVHKCSETCHPQDEQPAHCPYSPDVVSHCPCGKSTLEELLEQPRQSCEDLVPHCEKPCEKALPCGHLCRAKCHIGDCGFCYENIDLPCRCGRTTTNSICHQGDIQHPQCFRVCQANLSCGRHKCAERCCSGEKMAAERQAAKRKHKVPSQIPAFEAEHICIKTCGRALKCGSHACQQMCHRGPCGSCPEAIFHEISCDCGRTVLQPPQPCGTRPPECRFNCLRRPGCGHPPVEHNCHGEDVACPKCPFLVEKWCACGKERLHSQPCHLQEAHCGRPCKETLNCGLHTCKKLCHRPGECQDEGASKKCGQVCGKTKLFCEHACQNTCHGQTPCNEAAPCTAKTTIVCPCGHRSQELRCLASSSNPTPVRPEIKCDDECLRLDRNRRLAAALNIDPTSHQTDHVPYSDATLRLFQDSPSWAETQEREFRVFAKSPNEARLKYKPMPSAQRQFLHVLAEDYGLESKSDDVEPFRYVVVFKGSRFVSAPAKTLAQCVKIRATQAAEAAAASRPPSPPPLPVSEPFNALLLTAPRFGLTIEDVTTALKADFAKQPSLHYTVEFLPSDEILLPITAHYSAFLSPIAMEQTLMTLRPRLLETVEKPPQLAGGVVLCHVDTHGAVSRRQNISGRDASGWSAVAGRAAVKKDALTKEEPSASSSGRKLLGLRKKKVEKDKAWAAQLDGDVEC